MTDHPCKGMTPAQRRDFERIAIGQQPLGGWRVTAKLVDRGLVVKATAKRVGVDAFGPIMVPDWFVPLAVHAQWCAWCSEQAFAEEP